MALVATISKKSVTLVQHKLWEVTLNMILTDDVEVLNKDYAVRYRTGDSVQAKAERFADMMQEDIEKYKSEQMIFNAPALDTVVTNVQAALEV
jgi:hypothetical protein